jgi:hypothetical protein
MCTVRKLSEVVSTSNEPFCAWAMFISRGMWFISYIYLVYVDLPSCPYRFPIPLVCPLYRSSLHPSFIFRTLTSQVRSVFVVPNDMAMPLKDKKNVHRFCVYGKVLLISVYHSDQVCVDT